MSKKSFLDQQKSLRLNSNAKVAKYLLGKTIEIIANNNSGHNYGNIGTKVKVTNSVSTGSISSSYATISNLTAGNYSAIYFSEFSVVTEETIDGIKESIAELKKDKKNIDSEIALQESKIAFMEANGIATYDEDEFKVFKTLEVLDNPKTSKIDKAKIIASLIKQ